jgi:hypothetical protein
MKKLLVITGAMLCSVGAFAQGSLFFSLNSDNLIYFSTATQFDRWGNGIGILPFDSSKTFSVAGVGGPFPLVGSLASTDGSIPVLAGSHSFIVGLFAGTSSTALTLQTTTTIDSWANSNPGGIVAVNVNMGAPIAPGTVAWFQVQVYDSLVANAPAAWSWGGLYAGESPIFQATPLTVPDFLYKTQAPVNSTWAPGTFNPTDLSIILGGPGGGFGGIALYAVVIPEPGTVALAGLSLAALLVFRRRS